MKRFTRARAKVVLKLLQRQYPELFDVRDTEQMAREQKPNKRQRDLNEARARAFREGFDKAELLMKAEHEKLEAKLKDRNKEARLQLMEKAAQAYEAVSRMLMDLPNA